MILFVQILLKRDFQRCISISCQQHPSKRAKWVCYGVLQMKFLIRFNIYNEIANACIFILNKTALNAFDLTDSWFLTPSFNRKYENVNKFSLKKKRICSTKVWAFSKDVTEFSGFGQQNSTPICRRKNAENLVSRLTRNASILLLEGSTSAWFFSAIESLFRAENL